MNVVYYFDSDRDICSGWKEGLKTCGVDLHAVSKKYGDLPKSITNVDLWVVENVNLLDLEWFSQTDWDGKLICLVKDFQNLFIKFAGLVDLWVEPVFYDRETENGFSKNNLPFYYCPLASQDSLVQFYTELNKEFDLSTDDPLKEEWNTVVIPKGTPHPETIYGRTKVNLNYQIPRKDYVYLNQKSFDIPMSGNFELSTIPQVVEIFEGKVGYTSEPEMKDKINYYLNHEEERTRMAIKAYEVCIAKHTYTYRMRDLLKKLELL